MSSADRVAAVIRRLVQCVDNTHALPAEYRMPKVIKPSNPFTNVLLGSVLTTFSAPPQILAHRQFFFCPIPETKK